MTPTAAGSERPDSADDPVPGSGDPAAVGTKGGGEWPSPSSPPSPEAPGSVPERAEALRKERREHTDSPDDDLHSRSRLNDPYDDERDLAGSGSTPQDSGRAAGSEPFEERDRP